jgi:uncharacterized protein (TIGR03086 family)
MIVDMNTPTLDSPTPATGVDGDPRAQFLGAIRTATPVVAGVRPNQHALPSPCVEFDVKGLLDHLTFVVRRVAKLCRGEEAFAPGSLGDPSSERTDYSLQWAAAAADVETALADEAVLGRTIVLPWAVLTGAEMLATYTGEISAHTWDLAMATGQAVAWDDDVLRVALATMQRDLPMADRTSMWEAFRANIPADVRFDPPFANAVNVSTDAPLIDRLVAWLGRQP